MKFKSIFSCFKSNSLNVDHQNIFDQDSCTDRMYISDISGPTSPQSLYHFPDSNIHIFTISEINVMTRGFSPINFLGSGRFGPVYRGFIQDKCRPELAAQPVAVKLLDSDGDQGPMEWLKEVILLGKFWHPHLVKLIGYCFEGDHRLLVYEYMARGTLENYLFRKCTSTLSWFTRIKIAIGAAKGLAFLHGREKPLIYRNFNTSNILLDNDYNPKISYFGVARNGSEEDNTHVSARVKNIFGYAAPEYVMIGLLTTKSDVYSFGVVLLELLTGKRAMDRYHPTKKQSLVEWARTYLKNHHKLDRIMDPKLEYSIEGANKVVSLALECLSSYPQSRPTMNHVIQIMEPILDIPITPFVYDISK